MQTIRQPPPHSLGLSRHADITNVEASYLPQDVAFSFLPTTKTVAAVAKGDKVTQRLWAQNPGIKIRFV